MSTAAAPSDFVWTETSRAFHLVNEADGANPHSRAACGTKWASGAYSFSLTEYSRPPAWAMSGLTECQKCLDRAQRILGAPQDASPRDAGSSRSEQPARDVRNEEVASSTDAGSALTKVEASAIRSLQRLAKNWPQSLTLASMGGTLVVVRTGDARFDYGEGSEREDAVLSSDFYGIPNTGGDW